MKGPIQGELKCDFITHNLDEITNFWRDKNLGTNLDKNLCWPIPAFQFSTTQQIKPGYYWFILDGWLFTHCWIEIVGWSENVICQSGSYIITKI